MAKRNCRGIRKHIMLAASANFCLSLLVTEHILLQSIHNGWNGFIFFILYVYYSRFHSLKTSALFTSQGTKYYHHFNISFCQKGPLAKASCHRNVSMKGNLQVIFRSVLHQSLLRNLLYWLTLSVVKLSSKIISY